MSESLRAARLFAYAIALPPLAVAPFALKRPNEPAQVGIAVLLVIAAALWLVPAARVRLARVWERSAALRAADAVLWNGLLVFVLAEALLAVAACFSSHPFLSAPHARAQWHVAEVRSRMKALNSDLEVMRPDAFNDSEWQVPKPAGLLRIAALGDSFAYGIVGHQRNFLTELERALGARLERPVEIANLGLPELDPIDYLYLLEQEGLRLEPDAVLVCLYSGNDFRRNRPPSWLDVRRYRTYEFPRRAVLALAERARRAVERHADAAEPALRRASVLGAGTYLVDDEPTLSTEAYQKIVTDYAEQLRTDAGADPEVIDHIETTLGLLDRIVATAKPRPVAIAVLPSELQVNPALEVAARAELGLAPGTLDLDRPFRVVAQHFAGRGVLVIDLRPALASAHRDAPAYHPRDTHWNTRGNAAAAAALADAIEPWLREVEFAEDR